MGPEEGSRIGCRKDSRERERALRGHVYRV